MKRLYHIMRPPAGAGRRLRAAHCVWIALALTGLGCWVGRLALLFSAEACGRLDRLELLCQAGYVQPAGSEYRLTREGQEQCVPLNYFHAPAASAPQMEEEFDWTPLYLPQPGWLDE